MESFQAGMSGKGGGGEGGGGLLGGGGGGDILGSIGKLLSKSKNSGIGSSTPADLSAITQQGKQGFVDMSNPGQDEEAPMGFQGYMQKIMRGG
jgi:hypothetical protein